MSFQNAFSKNFNTSRTSTKRVNIMAHNLKVTIPAAPANATTAPTDLLQRAQKELTPFSTTVLARYMSRTGIDRTEYPILVTVLVLLTESSPTEDLLLQAHTSFFSFGSPALIAYFNKRIWDELPVRAWYQYAVAKTRPNPPTDLILSWDWGVAQMERAVNDDARALVTKVKRYIDADPNLLEDICREGGVEMFKLKEDQDDSFMLDDNDNQVEYESDRILDPVMSQPRGVGAGQRVLPPLQPELAWSADTKRAFEETGLGGEREVKRGRMEGKGEGSSAHGTQRNPPQANGVLSGFDALLLAADILAANEGGKSVSSTDYQSEIASVADPLAVSEEDNQTQCPGEPLPSVESWIMDDEPLADRANSPQPSSKSTSPDIEIISLSSYRASKEDVEHVGEHVGAKGTMLDPLVIDDEDDLTEQTESRPSIEVLDLTMEQSSSEASAQDDDVDVQHPRDDSAISGVANPSLPFVNIDEFDKTTQPSGVDDMNEPAQGHHVQHAGCRLSREPHNLTHGEPYRLSNAPISPYCSTGSSTFSAGEVNVKACMCSKCRHHFSED